MTPDCFNAVEVEGYYEASGEQLQNWKYHKDFAGNKRHQILSIDLMLSELNLDAFEKSLEIMVRRHESLRTCFRLHEGKIRQCVLAYDHTLFAASFLDVSDVANNEQLINESMERYSYNLRHLDQAPLWRCLIFKISETDYYLCFIIHHMICDAWSCKVIYSELGELYESFKNGVPVHLAQLEMQLRDYAVWQRTWTAENKQSIHDYWTRKIEPFGNSIFMEKFLDRSRFTAKAPFCNEGRGRFVSKKELWHMLEHGKSAFYVRAGDFLEYTQLLNLSKYCSCSIWTILNASLQLLFLHLMGKEKILIAMPVISRHLPGVDKLIGCLGGAVYVYHSIDQEKTVKKYLQWSFIDFIEASNYLIYDHAEMDISDNGLRYFCDVFANYAIRSVITEKMPKPENTSLHKVLDTPEFYPLSCFIGEYEDGLLYNWKYNCDLYSAATIELMVEKQAAILAKMCHAPEMLIKDLIDIV